MKEDDLYIRETDKGRSVFAAKDLFKGDLIVRFKGKRCSKANYVECHNPDNNHYLQIDSDTYMGPSGDVDDYINHSCNPNSGIVYEKRGIFLKAIRDIKRDEEITFDYSTTMDEDLWEMKCLCEAEGCRGTVRDFKHLPEHVKKRYIDLGIVPPFILRKMQ